MDINFAAKTATCQVDEEKFDAATAIEALARADFPKSIVIQAENTNGLGNSESSN